MEQARHVTLARELTVIGMRQRFLLGRYNYMKYKELYLKNIQNAFIDTTSEYRTVTSAYSEAAGMVYEMNQRKNPFVLRKKQLNPKLTQFRVRRATQIAQELG